MTEEKQESLYLRRPVDVQYKISSPFGWRKDPIDPSKEQFHKGIDFSVPVGTPVKAMCEGEIFRSGYENPDNHSQGFGLRVWQEVKIEGKTYYLWYGHLSKIIVDEGNYIHGGDIVGLSGNSGRTTGPHLHVQARLKNTGTLFNIEFYI